MGAEMTFYITGKPHLWTVQEWIPRQRLVLVFQRGSLTIRYTYSLSEHEEGTELHYLAEFEATGLFYKLMLPMVHFAFRSKESGHLVTFAAALRET